MRDILERHYGTDTADAMFREAGTLAGEAFFMQFLADQKDFNAFVVALQDLLRDFAIGILRIETADLENGRLVITVGEDLDCSGLPEMDHEFCAYDEGFIAGILSKFLGKSVSAKEIDCWCTGDRTCRFNVHIS
jgi:predicted hydrocarbon binding protein